MRLPSGKKYGAKLATPRSVTCRLCDPSARIVVVGDLNDYWFSRPLSIVESQEGALPPPLRLTDLLETLPENERYTYVFDGNSQALDGGILVSPALLPVMEYDAVHVNAEFQDQEKGTISPGKLADMVLVSDDFFSLPPEKIRDAKVLQTWVAGKVVFSQEK